METTGVHASMETFARLSRLKQNRAFQALLKATDHPVRGSTMYGTTSSGRL